MWMRLAIKPIAMRLEKTTNSFTLLLIDEIQHPCVPRARVRT
jgi:hypothetical protein